MKSKTGKKAAATIMVQGTASHVGKSAIAAALCRIFARDGYRVAPFKSWNMALNSYVTKDGGEIGRAQGEQAEAAGIEATVDMNPLLIKPSGPGRSQVVVRGRVHRDITYGPRTDADYIAFCLQIIEESLVSLREEYEIIVLEGAGSPAEINLMDTDVANMKTAHLADAPVLLVSDIDRGGAIAAAVGTVMLLPTKDRARVAGFIMNKFRGDQTILAAGLKVLEERTGLPVFGVVPYLQKVNLAEEDGVALDISGDTYTENGVKLRICVIRLPHISNFTDFDALQSESDVALFYSYDVDEIAAADAVIIPGSKNSMRDLLFLQEQGIAQKVIALAAAGIPVVGICGGYQMLGTVLEDPAGTEFGGIPTNLQGLGLLNTKTRFFPEKKVGRVSAISQLPGLYGLEVSGYEIHMGQTELGTDCQAAFVVDTHTIVGATTIDGAVWGTYLHGVFDQACFRRRWLDMLRVRRGWQAVGEAAVEERGHRFDMLADAVEASLDMPAVYKLLGLPGLRKEPR